MNINVIDKAYSGKHPDGRGCRCGCKGKYYEASNPRHKTQIARILDIINQNIVGAEIWVSQFEHDQIINVDLDGRSYTVYTKKEL